MNRTFKSNTLELLKHHKRNCEGETCNVSLIILRMMAEKAGVEFTKKELEEFV